MEHKITSIKKKVSKKDALPDGYYIGNWTGFIISVTSQNVEYLLTTQRGGKGVKVVIEVKEGIATFNEVNK